MIPQRGKWSNNKKACGKTGLTPPICFGWPCPVSSVAREWKSVYLFVLFTHVSSDITGIWAENLFGLRALLHFFRTTPRLSLNHPDSDRKKTQHRSGAWRFLLTLTSPGATSSKSRRASGFCCFLVEICTFSEFWIISFFVYTQNVPDVEVRFDAEL